MINIFHIIHVENPVAKPVTFLITEKILGQYDDTALTTIYSKSTSLRKHVISEMMCYIYILVIVSRPLVIRRTY